MRRAVETHGKCWTRNIAFPAHLECRCGTWMNIWAVHASVSARTPWRWARGTSLRGWPPRSHSLASQHHAHPHPSGGFSARTSWPLWGRWLGFHHTHGSSHPLQGDVTTKSWDFGDLPFLFYREHPDSNKLTVCCCTFKQCKTKTQARKQKKTHWTWSEFKTFVH